jgi:acetyl esterase/lipase
MVKVLVMYHIKPFCFLHYCISSGGGLAVNLMQRLVAEKKLDLLPAGVVLMCPFVDYTEPCGSMLHYTRHDLIVNQVSYGCLIS